MPMRSSPPGAWRPRKTLYAGEAFAQCLSALEDQETYGIILRAKGIVAGENGQLDPL